MRSPFVLLGPAVLLWNGGLLLAQNTTEAAQLRHRGPYLANVSAYSTYYSVGIAEGYGFANLGADAALGGSATVRYATSGERNHFGFSYTGSYSSRVRYSEWRSANHGISLEASRHLTPRWSLSGSLSGALSGMDEFQFMESRSATIVSAAGTYEEFTAALRGATTNDALASLLTGAALVESPSRSLFYGSRALDTSAHAILTYARSSRLSISLGGGGSRLQHVRGNSTEEASSYALGRTTSGNATAGLSYALSPRTQLGASASATRTVSIFEDAYFTSGRVSLGRNMGQHWMLQAYGGLGTITAQRHLRALPTGPQYVAGGSVGYRLYSHSFVLSHDRTIGDSFGFGASATVSSDAAWRYARPGRSWALMATGGRQQMQVIGYRDNIAWRASAGITRSLGRSASLVCQYSYTTYSGTLGSGLPEYAQHAVRFGVSWNPDFALLR